MKLIQSVEDHLNSPHNPMSPQCNQCGKAIYACDVCGQQAALSGGEVLAWRIKHGEHAQHDAGDLKRV